MSQIKMDSSNNNDGFPITITYYTEYRTIFQGKINSRNNFNSILELFKTNSTYNNQARLKRKYFLQEKEIEKKQILEELIKQNNPESLNDINKFY